MERGGDFKFDWEVVRVVVCFMYGIGLRCFCIVIKVYVVSIYKVVVNVIHTSLFAVKIVNRNVYIL